MRKKKQAARIGSRIGRGAEARGCLIGEGYARVEGLLIGRVDWTGTLEIAPDGRVEADGHATHLEVRGSLEGNLKVGVEAFVFGTGSWVGIGVAPSLGTEAGSRLEGTFRVGPVELVTPSPTS